MGYEPGIFREILVTSAKEVYLEIPLKESVNELSEVVVRARTNKEEAMNKMATTGARMPVSYTHLDVYKRQGHFLRLADGLLVDAAGSCFYRRDIPFRILSGIGFAEP